MGRRVIEVFPSRWLVLGGAIMMGTFAVVAFVFRRLDVSEGTLSLVAGVLAYGFIAYALLVAFVAWSGRSRRGAHMVAKQFAEEHPTITRTIGAPVGVRLRPSRMERADGGALRVHADLSGVLGEGDVVVGLHPDGDDWRVSEARLTDDSGERALDVAPATRRPVRSPRGRRR